MRRIVLLVTVVALMSVVGAGVACAAKIYGTNGPNTLNGTNRADIINGRSGDDIINGGEGHDLLIGGEGDDTMHNLRNTYLYGAYLYYANLEKADLSEAHLEGAHLSHARLAGADLRYAVLGEHREITVSRTPARKFWGNSITDLSNADLRGADLSNADLSRANLSGADLEDARGITNEALEQQAKSLSGATMPDGQKYEDWLKSKGSILSKLRRLLRSTLPRPKDRRK